MNKKISISSGIFGIFFLVSISYGLGIMFAKKNGKEVRENIAKSKLPFITFIKELMEVDIEIFKFLHDKLIMIQNKK